MPNLSRLTLGAGLLACVCSMTTAGQLKPGKHISVGVQGATAMAIVDHQSTFFNDPGDGDIWTQSFNHSTNDNVQFAGATVGYSQAFDPDIWTVSLSLNRGFGLISTADHVDADLTEDGDSFDLISSLKLRNQFNLMLEWKHPLSHQLYFSAGMGLSSLGVSNRLSVFDCEDEFEVNLGPTSQTKYNYGAALSSGVEYFVNAHSSLSATAHYFLYNAHDLNDYDDFYHDYSDAPDDFDHLHKRKKTISLLMLTLGYSYYF